ncbi:MAG: hypothetical protein IKN73_01395 [Alphaproteobacteria bacterium]|nr:hypothetical protein [Alphaproteobacteria bacterium]
MKNKDFKTFFMCISALMGSALISCGRVSTLTSTEKDDHTKLPKQEQKYDLEQNQRICQKYEKMYADSIRFANGYDSICNKSNMLWEKTAELESRADSLAMENSLGAVMQREVEGAANKILKVFLNNVSDILKTYQISLKDYITEDNDFLWRFNTNTQEDNYDAMDYVLKQPLIYFGVNTCGFSDISGKEFDEFMVVINQIINESNYAKTHKKEIINKINVLIKKTTQKLIASRKSIERKYSDYYVVIDGQDAAFISYGADDWNYGYTDTEYPERQAVIKVTTLSVYGKNLPVEFFGDKKAKYELVRLENNRWQVKKTSRRGIIENTDVFTDKGETSIQEYYAGFNTRNYSEFRFDPGHDCGVHIEVEDGVVVKKAKHQWWPSRNIINQIDSLEDESRKYASQAAKLEEQKKIINQYADSVARVMVNQRCK